MKWLQKAADADDPEAWGELGDLYRDGNGVSADYVKAHGYYLKAADRGDAYSQYRLGQMYESAMGVAQDYAAALGWYLIAARNDNDDARAAVTRLRPSMSGGDIGRAQARADAFKPQVVADGPDEAKRGGQ